MRTHPVSKHLSRFDFLKLAGLTIAALFSWAFSSCSEDKTQTDAGSGDPPSDPSPSPDCLNAGTIVSIGANHGHTLTVSKADVAAGLQKTYNITGSSGHTHLVTLSTSNFASLASNQPVVVTSTSGNGHTHSVSVSCASS